MGSNHSIPQNKAHLELSSFEHPHLGRVEPHEQPQNLMKVFSFGDVLMSQQKLRRINTRIKKFNPSTHIIQVKSAQLKQKQQMCAHNSEIHIIFEKYDNDLRSVIKEKLNSRKNFTEFEICQFLKHSVEGLIYIQDNGLKNCILDKDSILLCGNNIKIIDTSLSSYNTYQQLLSQDISSNGIYLSPELLKEMKENNYDPYFSPKSDVFTLGMLILEMACLQPLDSFYNYKQFTLDYESLIHRVSRILYSVELKTLIAGMLELEPQERLGLISLHEKILKIINPDEAHQKTQRSRSTSTKMLKQLLTNSRKSIVASTLNNKEPTMMRKNSSTSLASVASIKERISVTKKSQNDKKIRKKQSSTIINNEPADNNLILLKNIVKAKTSTNNGTAHFGSQMRVVEDKENKQKKHNDTYMSTMELLEMAKNPKIESKSFSKDSFLKQKQIKFKTENDEQFKVGMPDCSAIAQTPQYDQSIFKMIEDQYDKKSYKTIKQSETINIFTNTKSPYNLPKIPNVVNTNSIEKCELQEKIVTEVNEFNQTLTPQVKQPASVSAKIKDSLDKMYKTTKSINSSEQKPRYGDTYTKITLEDGLYYEGQVKQRNKIEGNGILYTEDHKTIYSGSWINGKYDGFGTLNNLCWIKGNVSKEDLESGNQCWVKYEGEFKKGEKQGFGTVYYSNGQRFSGCFRGGGVNGYGCFYDSGNQMTSGIWNANKMQNYQVYS